MNALIAKLTSGELFALAAVAIIAVTWMVAGVAAEIRRMIACRYEEPAGEDEEPE